MRALGLPFVLASALATALGCAARAPVQPADPPTPVIEVQEGHAVTAQTLLHLDGSGSHAAGGGTVTAYQWSVDAPVGAAGSFEPSEIAASPTFRVDVVGGYTFHLDVLDGATASLQAADYQVTVTPATPFSVELTWVTPGDPDETDTGPEAGSDVDLHLVQPGQPTAQNSPDLDGDGEPDPYFDTRLDCFWFNPNPDWGATGTANNPRMDRDDTDGAGPEVISVAQPQSNLTYVVAVHYWRSHGYGPVTASVRVLLDGEEALSRADVALQEKDLWHVATIDTTTMAVELMAPPGGTGDWITHDYDPPGFTG